MHECRSLLNKGKIQESSNSIEIYEFGIAIKG